jgi:parallel beta-helix repeat protein
MDQLVVALSKAETNKQDDVIKLVKGEYINNFNYLADPNYALSLSGGYVAGCSRQVIGPGATVLDGGNLSRTLYILNTEGGNISISNLTIRNGEDGGLWIEDNTANLTFSRVNFFNNDGLGIWVYSGKSFTVDRCQFNQNNYGGIETTGFDRLIIRNSTFKNNNRDVNGAGVHANGVRSIVLEKNTFIGNQTNYNMGGAFLGGTSAKTTAITVKNNIFDSNSGGLAVTNLSAESPMGSALISGNKFINNSRGGMYADMAKTIKIYGNVLYLNKGYGPAIGADGPSVDVQNNIVANNMVDLWNEDWPAVGVRTRNDGGLVKVQ